MPGVILYTATIRLQLDLLEPEKHHGTPKSPRPTCGSRYDSATASTRHPSPSKDYCVPVRAPLYHDAIIIYGVVIR